MTTIGIHDLSLATTHHVVRLEDLASGAGIDPNKYVIGLGQDGMSFPAADEDIVTMGAAAALPILERHGTEGLRTLLFATESGIDQSKSGGVYVHRLLGLPTGMRTFEIKQACYGATGALQMAMGIIARNPTERVLVIASDVARYELGSPGEPTQGAAAVALLAAADPAILAIEPVYGVTTADVDDFWRPNDSTTAVVDGPLSLTAYLDSLTTSWDDFRAQGGVGFDEIDQFIYHQPFTKMARKGHAHLAKHAGGTTDTSVLEPTFTYNRALGNSYTASMYAALAALLDQSDALAGQRVGLFSYGSGSVGEFFTGIVQPDYAKHTRGAQARAAIDARVPLSLDEYRALHAATQSTRSDVTTPRVTAGPFRFTGVQGRARQYEATGSRTAESA